jgi:hypothetical protein
MNENTDRDMSAHIVFLPRENNRAVFINSPVQLPITAAQNSKLIWITIIMITLLFLLNLNVIRTTTFFTTPATKG